MLVAVLLLEVGVAFVSATPSPASTARLVGSQRQELASSSEESSSDAPESLEQLKQLDRLRCQLETISAPSVCGADGANLTEAQLASFRELSELSVSAPTLICRLSARAGCRRPHWYLRRSRECNLARAVWPQLLLPPDETQASPRNAGKTICSVLANTSTSDCWTPQHWFHKCYSSADRIRSSNSSFATLVTGAYERATSLLLMWKALEFVLNSSAVRPCEAKHNRYVQWTQWMRWVQWLVPQLEDRVNLRWIELLCSSHHLALFASMNRSLSGSVPNLTALTTMTIAAAQRVERRAAAIAVAVVRALENTASENESDDDEELEPAQTRRRMRALREKFSSTASENPTRCRNARRTLRAASRVTLAYLGQYELPLISALENNAELGTSASSTDIRT